MRIWDYYIAEDLAHGPPYEMEIVQKELALNEDVTAEGNTSSRKIINICFDSVLIQEPESFKVLLQVRNICDLLKHLEHLWVLMYSPGVQKIVGSILGGVKPKTLKLYLLLLR